MDFWKRLRRIASGLVVVLWFVLLAASGSDLARSTARPPPCTSNCL